MGGSVSEKVEAFGLEDSDARLVLPYRVGLLALEE